LTPQHFPGDATCFATRRGFELLVQDPPVRPFPVTHSIPRWFPLHKVATRTPYEGEPREEMRLLEVPEPQLWGPRWLDVIVELWAGPIELGGPAYLAQRNDVIQTVVTLWTSSMKRKIWESVTRDGDLRAARDYLAPVIKGPLPMLIAEVERAPVS
jgi:hypothetical protein